MPTERPDTLSYGLARRGRHDRETPRTLGEERVEGPEILCGLVESHARTRRSIRPSMGAIAEQPNPATGG